MCYIQSMSLKNVKMMHHSFWSLMTLKHFFKKVWDVGLHGYWVAYICFVKVGWTLFHNFFFFSRQSIFHMWSPLCRWSRSFREDPSWIAVEQGKIRDVLIINTGVFSSSLFFFFFLRWYLSSCTQEQSTHMWPKLENMSRAQDFSK